MFETLAILLAIVYQILMAFLILTVIYNYFSRISD